MDPSIRESIQISSMNPNINDLDTKEGLGEIKLLLDIVLEH